MGLWLWWWPGERSATLPRGCSGHVFGCEPLPAELRRWSLPAELTCTDKGISHVPTLGTAVRTVRGSIASPCTHRTSNASRRFSAPGVTDCCAFVREDEVGKPVVVAYASPLGADREAVLMLCKVRRSEEYTAV